MIIIGMPSQAGYRVATIFGFAEILYVLPCSRLIQLKINHILRLNFLSMVSKDRKVEAHGGGIYIEEREIIMAR